MTIPVHQLIDILQQEVRLDAKVDAHDLRLFDKNGNPLGYIETKEGEPRFIPGGAKDD